MLRLAPGRYDRQTDRSVCRQMLRRPELAPYFKTEMRRKERRNRFQNGFACEPVRRLTYAMHHSDLRPLDFMTKPRCRSKLGQAEGLS